MVRPAELFRACYPRSSVNDTVMAFSRFRDRSGLTTRRRVIAYLERERRNNVASISPVNPVEPNTSDYQLFFMSGMMGSAPNRESPPEVSLRPVFFMTGLMGVAPNRTVNSVI